MPRFSDHLGDPIIFSKISQGQYFVRVENLHKGFESYRLCRKQTLGSGASNAHSLDLRTVSIDPEKMPTGHPLDHDYLQTHMLYFSDDCEVYPLPDDWPTDLDDERTVIVWLMSVD